MEIIYYSIYCLLPIDHCSIRGIIDALFRKIMPASYHFTTLCIEAVELPINLLLSIPHRTIRTIIYSFSRKIIPASYHVSGRMFKIVPFPIYVLLVFCIVP